MIQRVQTLYWLASIFFLIALFWVPLFGYGPTGSETNFTAKDCTVLMVFAGLSILCSGAAISQFKNRALQVKLGYLNIALLVVVHFLLWAHYYLLSQGQAPAVAGAVASILPWVGLPTLAFIFNMLAIGGVKRDLKIVKAADRLR